MPVKLLSSLASIAPNVDLTKPILTSATKLRKVFPAETIPGILVAYLRRFAIVITVSGLATVVTLGSRGERNCKG